MLFSMPQIISDGHHDALRNLFRRAVEVKIASAYFAPDRATVNLLSKVPAIKLLVASNQWAVNNAHTLEELASRSGCDVREFDGEPKRLHAKVLLARAADGTRRGIVGSANLTASAVGIGGQNVEVGVGFADAESDDSSLLDELDGWFSGIWRSGTAIDFAAAKLAFDRTSVRGQVRTVLREMELAGRERQLEGERFWAIKTRELGRIQRWPLFIGRGIVGVFWRLDYPDELDGMTKDELAGLVLRAKGCTPEEAARQADSILRFLMVGVGHRVLVCNGFSWDRPDSVVVYAIGEITSKPYVVRDEVCPLRADARLLTIDCSIERKRLAAALGKKSLMAAVHELDEAQFRAVLELLGR
jgi:PLD-like domain